MNYTPISFKSDYSLLRSLLKISDIINYAKGNNSSYIGLLDDNPYGIVDFYMSCKKNNLKCIFGMSISIGNTKMYLYIKNYIGYQNLIKINDFINNKKFSIDILFRYNDGLIAVLPYHSYNIYNRIKAGLEVYLGYKSESELKRAIQISKNVLFINEIMYLKKEEKSFIDVLYKINDSVYEDDTNYVLNASESDILTIDNFVNNIDFQLDFSKRYIPVMCKTKDESKEFLRSLSMRGLNKRLNGKVTDLYKNRLEFELGVIEKMGYVDYFLIVYDYIKYAKKNDIMVGPGRGSAVGSLVSYSLGIIDIDPLKYDLYFERFLNPERVSMPDIDVDFEDIRRKDIVTYIREKYGDNKVALVGAYGTLAARQALRDSGKVLGIDQSIIDLLSKKIDSKKSLKDNLKGNDELVEFIKNNKLENVYKIAIKLEGLKKNTTIHAAGVVISSIPLIEVIPTYQTLDGTITGVTKDYLEDMGLLKMDILAITNLTMLHNIINLIHKKDSNFNIMNIPLDDKEVYKVFAKGDTDNVFQFESNGMRNFLRKLCPSRFDDLVAANALFRPGPMDNIDEYCAGRHGKKQISYLHKDLEPILKSTYGIIVYQEQIMQILSKMGGYSFAEADIIRRAMSKKKHDVIQSERVKFIESSKKLGYDENISKNVYDLIVKFANYGFNKSHSVAYALIAYQIVYLKVHYPDYFQMNTLNMSIKSDAKVKDVIDDAKYRGLRIINPDVNISKMEYLIEDGKLYLPLSIIKDINSGVNKQIIENAPYSDFFDFIKKVYNKGINKTILEKLIKAGALSSFGYSKNTLLENINSAVTYLELCDSLDESLIMKPEIVESKTIDEDINELEVFGFYISGHPANKIKDTSIIKLKNVEKYMNRNISVGVLVENIKVINTKKGEKMAFVKISDDTGSVDAVIFPKSNSIIEVLKEDDVVCLDVMISKRDNDPQVIINKVKMVS